MAMPRSQHHRAFVVSVVWTLVLLFLGSVVHATESSLACPDWPTCYGSMMPEMTGGVFWEHLHRLVAGGLILMWGLSTFLAYREGAGDRVVHWGWAGLALLLVQAVFGGLTVIYGLPDAVSTTHLGLALLFLVLAAVLAEATSPYRPAVPPPSPEARRSLRGVGTAAAVLVFAQSILGGWVRHADAGTACGVSGVLCLDYPGFPPVSDPLALIHFLHRVVGVLTALAVVAAAATAARRMPVLRVRWLAWSAGGLVLFQVGLGFASAWTALAVVPVSLHTLVAAVLLVTLAALVTHGWPPPIPAHSAPERGRARAGA